MNDLMKIARIGALLLSLLVLVTLIGCGATSGGYGADAGPWPQESARSRQAPTRQSTEEAPTMPLQVLLRGSASKENELRLDIAHIDLKFGNQWVPVTTREKIATIEALPLRFGEKSTIALLANTTVPRKPYTHLRLRLDDGKTLIATGEVTHALTLKTTTLELGEWTPAAETMNTLLVTLDGTKVTVTGDSATLPSEALTVDKRTPTAGITGKLVPALPTARVEVYWGKSKLLMGSTTPNADGAFTIAKLPPGSYRLEMTTPGFHQIEPRKELIALDMKLITLDDTQLSADTAK